MANTWQLKEIVRHSAYFSFQMEKVILVDTEDQPIGTMEKMEAHRQGALHRAFSIMIFNSKGEVLLQKRAKSKYHSGGLWTNACCSHPGPGDDIELATQKKLMLEMGLDVSPVFAFKFLYHADVGKGLIEHEYDHVYIGISDDLPVINTHEVEDWKLMKASALHEHVGAHPGTYTPWFRLILTHPDFVSLNPSG